MVKTRSGPIRQAIGPRKARLKELINQCGVLKQEVARLGANDIEGTLIIQIEELCAKLETSLDGLKESENKWQELIENLAPEEVADEDAMYQQFVSAGDNHLVTMDEGRESLSILRVTLARLQASLKVNTSAADNSTSNQSKKGASKLPKLILPVYEGDLLLWTQFWAIFEANIHDTDLRGVEKLTYLRGQLRGKALETIEGLEIVDESYQTAVDLLKKRFQRTPEKVINHLYSDLKKMPTSSAKVDDMQRTFDGCERIFRQLKTEGEDIDSNRSLVMDVMSKYPPDVLTELSRRHPTQTLSNVGKVQSAFREYIEEARTLQGMLSDLEPFGGGAKSKSRTTTSPSSSGSTSNSWRSDSRSDGSIISSALTATGESSAQMKETPATKPCYFCDGSHFNSQCPVYTTTEDRERRLEQVKRCRRCLSNTHLIQDCRTRPQRIRCYFCDKTGLHVSPLCTKEFSKDQNKVDQSGQGTKAASSTASALCSEERAVLATAVAFVLNPNSKDKRRVRIILDCGSHRSYVTEAIAGELGLVSEGTESLNVAVFGSKRSLSVATHRVELCLELRDGSTKTINAHTTPVITNFALSSGQLPETTRNLVSTLKHAMADDFDLPPGPPDVLIGSDYFWEFVSGSRVRSDDGIYLISSKFGLVLGGRYEDGKSDGHRAVPSLLCLTERQPTGQAGLETCLAANSVAGQVEPDLDEFWNMERIGISDSPNEKDDDIAQQHFDSTVAVKKGRYHVRWPWKKQKCDLPTNYQLALGRFKSLARRLNQNENNIRNEYSKVIADQVSRGVIEEVPASERWASNNMLHYLPHHPVVRVNSNTTKVRIVYDASARIKKDQPCLNECMYRGPVVLPNLCSILLRFRLHNVVMIADIEKAYLQLSLHEEDRDVTRFLWFKNADKPDVNQVTMYRFTRVPFGIISSQFLLGATIHHHLGKYNTPTAEMIDQNNYVDNVFVGAKDVKSGYEVYQESKSIFSDAGMNLREWASNSQELTSKLPSADRVEKVIVKVLGLAWDRENDTIAIHACWSNYEHCKTKREVLQAVASFYDPLGLFQPCLHPAKCFLRDLWKTNLKWDDQLSEAQQKRWESLHRDIQGVFDVTVTRHIVMSSAITVVAFADASGDAYATSVYLRAQVSGHEHWVSTLVFAKSRLAPKKTAASEVSLPRLELMGLVIAVRAANFVRASISPANPVQAFILTDSSCVIGWVRSNKSLPVFVSNRIKEIRSSANSEFHHVDTSDNAADLATRGKTGKELANCDLWWKGPSWLQQGDSEWPTRNTVKPVDASEIQELGQSCGQETFSLVAVPDTAEEDNGRPCGINPAKYSSFLKLLRVTVLCLKFVAKQCFSRRDSLPNVFERLRWIFSQLSTETRITSNDLRIARKLWVKSAQGMRYQDVIEALHQNKRHSLAKQLNLYLDEEQIIRCGGRMRHADLPEDAINPMLLPKDDTVTILVIRECHCGLLHCGISHTLSQLRRIFWVPQGRNAVRKVIRRCTICRKFKGPPFALPNMPPLPKQRVSRAAPFQFSGVDYFGPIAVSINGMGHKMWVALFTCLTIRAVHLEPVTDCTAQSFIECMSRFISRRGCPEEIISDNAPQFRVAKNLFDRTWHTTLTHDQVTSYLSAKAIRWKFTTELAPWQGGVYERLVGVVKGVLRVGIGRQRLEWTQLTTLLAEVEAIVNSRPITYVCSDLGSGMALRPMDFLTEMPVGIPEIGPNEKPTGGDASRNIIRYWKLKQRKIQKLWEQWYDDYLLSMRERGQLCHKTGRRDIHARPAVNEVVLIKEADAPRGLWKLGVVIKLLPAGGETCRSAELRLANGQHIRRPLNHLYQLEIPVVTSSDGNSNQHQEEHFEGFDSAEVMEAEQRVNRFQRVSREDHGSTSTALLGVIACRIYQGLGDSQDGLEFCGPH